MPLSCLKASSSAAHMWRLDVDREKAVGWMRSQHLPPPVPSVRISTAQTCQCNWNDDNLLYTVQAYKNRSILLVSLSEIPLHSQNALLWYRRKLKNVVILNRLWSCKEPKLFLPHIHGKKVRPLLWVWVSCWNLTEFVSWKRERFLKQTPVIGR